MDQEDGLSTGQPSVMGLVASGSGGEGVSSTGTGKMVRVGGKMDGDKQVRFEVIEDHHPGHEARVSNQTHWCVRRAQSESRPEARGSAAAPQSCFTNLLPLIWPSWRRMGEGPDVHRLELVSTQGLNTPEHRTWQIWFVRTIKWWNSFHNYAPGCVGLSHSWKISLFVAITWLVILYYFGLLYEWWCSCV